MASVDQQSLNLAWGMQKGPSDMPMKIVCQFESESQALDAAIKFSGHKNASLARAIGKSEGYVSRMRNGKRFIPSSGPIVGQICAATGTNLLRQVREFLSANNETDRLVSMMRAAA